MLSSESSKKRIIIKREPRFCRSVRFSSDLPIELHGIIDPYEFAQTIQNINNANRNTLLVKLILFVPIFVMIVGLILLLLLNVKTISKKAFIPILVVGIVLIISGKLMFICLAICVGTARGRRCRELLIAESRKYSTKYGIPIVWKLEAIHSGFGRNHTVIFILVIEIYNPKMPYKLPKNT